MGAVLTDSQTHARARPLSRARSGLPARWAQGQLLQAQWDLLQEAPADSGAAARRRAELAIAWRSLKASAARADLAPSLLAIMSLEFAVGLTHARLERLGLYAALGAPPLNGQGVAEDYFAAVGAAAALPVLKDSAARALQR